MNFIILCTKQKWCCTKKHSFRCVKAHTIPLLIVQIIVYVDLEASGEWEWGREELTSTCSDFRFALETWYSFIVNGSFSVSEHTESNQQATTTTTTENALLTFSHDEVKITWTSLFLLIQPPDFDFKVKWVLNFDSTQKYISFLFLVSFLLLNVCVDIGFLCVSCICLLSALLRNATTLSKWKWNKTCFLI